MSPEELAALNSLEYRTLVGRLVIAQVESASLLMKGIFTDLALQYVSIAEMDKVRRGFFDPDLLQRAYEARVTLPSAPSHVELAQHAPALYERAMRSMPAILKAVFRALMR